MVGALLRTGKSSSFKALGKTGQPVYRAALQLRNAIQRKHPLAADSLAIPQSDQQGDNIDWYSPVAGNVVPWSAATEEERDIARLQLKALESVLTNLRHDILSAGAENTHAKNTDKQVFAELLEHVIRFPGKDFVYIVQTQGELVTTSGELEETSRSNSIAVLTFWGFVHPEDDLGAEPLYCLYPPKVTKPVASAPASSTPALNTFRGTTVPESVPPVSAPVMLEERERRSWWRRWWWLLLPLLLLLLLLFLLRGCVPGMTLPGLSAPNVGLSVPNLPSASWPAPSHMPTLSSAPGLELKGASLASLPEGGTGGIAGPVAYTGGQSGSTTPTQAMMPSLPDAGADISAFAETPDQGSPSITPPVLPEDDPVLAMEPPVIPNMASEANPVPPALPDDNRLTIPANAAANGPADFLNGNWQAGAGIQDKRTGKPLRLEYQFKEGQGEVTVRRPDGVSCAGPVSAAMNNGNLSFNSQGQAVCADGGSYEMPAVSCQQGAGTMADCSGSYGHDHFPMTMRNAGE